MMKKEKTKLDEWQGLSSRSEGRQFFVLAVIILPLMLLLGVAAYGFVVWMAQVLYFGPPT